MAISMATNIDTIGLTNQMRVMAAQANGAQSYPTDNSFNSILQNQIDNVNQLTRQAEELKTRYEFNDPEVSIAQAMVAEQKANLGFQAMLSVRNKIVQAYQDVMNMPV